MFSYIDKKLLGRFGRWNHRPQILEPEGRPHKRVVILIHGFIGSPFDMEPLGQALAGEGFKVIIPATPGQSWDTTIRKRGRYDKTFYINWLLSIVQDWTAKTGVKPYLAGLSMGGTLSTLVAAQGVIEKLVLLAPFYKLAGVPDTVWKISKPLSGILPVVPKFSKGNINLKQGYRHYTPGSYFVSLKAFGHLGDLAFDARKAASKIQNRTKIFLSMIDRVADPQMTHALFHDMPNVQFHYENRANHILFFDYGADRIIREIIRFFI